MSTRALRTAASGMYAQQVNIEVISNNIANINTTSFKKNRAEFKDLMYQEVNTSSANSYIPGVTESPGSKIQIGNGIQLSSTQKVFTQGDLQVTNQQYDVAISGEGFFQVRRTDGTIGYTRDGSFKLSSDGTLVTASGYVMEPGIRVNSDIQSVEIAQDGSVTGIDTSGSRVDLGTLELAKFINPGGLTALGDNMFAETKESGIPLLGNPGQSGFGTVKQGALEASNVDIVDEMVSMISAQRAYEINSKTVKTVEDMITMVNNLKRT